jgi:hypothetical protein
MDTTDWRHLVMIFSAFLAIIITLNFGGYMSMTDKRKRLIEK